MVPPWSAIVSSSPKARSMDCTVPERAGLFPAGSAVGRH